MSSGLGPLYKVQCQVHSIELLSTLNANITSPESPKRIHFTTNSNKLICVQQILNSIKKKLLCPHVRGDRDKQTRLLSNII